MSCPYKVKPFPYLFCEGCMLNGCYSWNQNPLLLCSLLGGIVPAILFKENEMEIPRQCASYKQVTDKTWLALLKDLKQEAKRNEGLRKLAMGDGKTYSSNELPAEASKK